MRAKTIIPTWTEICEEAPEEIKKYLYRCEKTLQSPKWHPEGNCLIHTNIVYNRARKTGNLDFAVSALFHDLGKANVTKLNSKGTWSAPGHEYASLKLVEKYKDWIEKLGANYDIVHFIVKEHMRAKQIDNMRPFKRQQLMSHPYYSYVEKFTQFDNMKINYSDDIN